ncbi:MAG TPA: hypothetical protein VMR41_04095 [Patescibacteria group bacterium]|nr:hypothetical protein [Patescibacteria group bacterium]
MSVKTSSFSFTLATYNIEFCRHPHLIVQNIFDLSKKGVNIFCLQEVIPNSKKEFIINKILEKLGNDWEAAWSIGEKADITGLGTAILWNKKMFKQIEIDKLVLPKLEKVLPHENVFSLANGYPGIVILRRALVVTFMLGDKKIRVSSVHADVLGGPRHRKKQMQYLLDYLAKKSKVDVAVVSGDFNTIDLSGRGEEQAYLSKLFGKYKFTDVTKDIEWSHDVYQASFGKDNLLVEKIIKGLNVHIRKKLDYIWSQGLKGVEAKRVDMSGSDHFPLLVKLKIL